MEDPRKEKGSDRVGERKEDGRKVARVENYDTVFERDM